MHDHWEKYPPVHMSVAIYLGMGQEKKAEVPIDNAALTADMHTPPHLVEWVNVPAT